MQDIYMPIKKGNGIGKQIDGKWIQVEDILYDCFLSALTNWSLRAHISWVTSVFKFYAGNSHFIWKLKHTDMTTKTQIYKIKNLKFAKFNKFTSRSWKCEGGLLFACKYFIFVAEDRLGA